jgi:acid phosphatase family membrane protein YuiD
MITFTDAGKVLLTVFIAAFIAQFAKVIIHFIHKKELDFSLFYRNGGMPSSHTAAVSALTTSVYIVNGLSTTFVICLVLLAIVMADALGVRQETGKQAAVINRLMIKEHVHLKKFTEFVGHNPSQVIIGFLLGILIGQIALIL